MNARERRIIELLCENGRLSIQELSDMLQVSPATVRRSLASLEQHRFVERMRGGARAAMAVNYHSIPVYKLPFDRREALAIASQAKQLIRPGDVIGISGGRLCLKLVMQIRLLENLTVVTNAVNVAAELATLPRMQVMVTGGRLNPGSFELVGQAVSRSLEQIRINKFFLGAAGITVEHGVMAHDEAEAVAARAIIKHSDVVIILADSLKFQASSFARVVPIADVDVIVTSDLVPEETRSVFEAAGVRVVAAPFASRVEREAVPERAPASPHAV